MPTDRSHGFAPIIGDCPRALVLGTLPSEASIACGQYYGHARNAFWPIVGALFGFDPALPYGERTVALAAAGLAVWDVLAAARRIGSLDSAIEASTETPNDIAGLLVTHRSIRCVFLNGGKAEALYRRYVVAAGTVDLPFVRLPSTSPAFAAMHAQTKLARWRQAFAAANLL